VAQDTWFDIVIPVQRLNENVITSVSSVLASKYEDFTIIIGLQNDPMTNNEQEYYEYLQKDKKIKVVDCKKSYSLPKTLNISLEQCSHKWTVRHDDDDLMHPTRLKNLNELIKMRREEPTIIGQQMRYFKLDPKTRRRYISTKWCKQKLNDFELKQELLVMPCFYHPAITLNLEKLKFHYNENYTYAQDYKLYIDNMKGSVYVGSATKGTYYRIKKDTEVKRQNTLDKQNTKRQMQLQFHEKIMMEMWSKIGIDLSAKDARMLRYNLVTKEEPAAFVLKSSDHKDAVDYFNKAKCLFKNYYESST